jgi:hypothetical protein
MKTSSLILYFLLLLAIPSTAQELYDLSGTVNACYNKNYKLALPDMSIRLILRSVENNREYTTTVKNEGNFSFESLPADNYVLSATALGLSESDTTIKVNQNVNSLSFCVDRAYRPAPIDSIERYRQKAISDVRNGRTKIYEWIPWSITKDPYEKLNPKVKKKYGYEYELMSCVRQQTREEIVQVKLWQAYNEVVYGYLAELNGKEWRKRLKHERKKLQKE